MRDIACAQYVAGGNCKFFATGQLSGGTASLGDCKNNMMKRLAFADDVGAPYDSMLAFPAHAGQFTNGALDTVMSITSRLLPWEVQSTSAPNAHNSFPGGEAVYKQYAINLQLHTIHFGEDMKSAENMEFISQGSTNNALCFTGPHRRYDPFAKGFFSLEPGQGHFGPDAIPGDARWRRGMRRFEPQPPLPRRSPPALALRRVRELEDRARLDDRPRARRTGADGLPDAALDARGAQVRRPRCPPSWDSCVWACMRVCVYTCVRVDRRRYECRVKGACEAGASPPPFALPHPATGHRRRICRPPSR